MIQKDTKEHRMARFQKINDKQRLAIFQRAEGIKFQDIADNFEISVFTVKNWFREGTDTKWLYRQYSRDRASEMTTEALHRSRMASEKAISVMERLMEDDMPPSIRFRASAYILDKNIPPAIAEEEGRYLYEIEGGNNQF